MTRHRTSTVGKQEGTTLLTTKQAAAFLNVSPRTLQDWRLDRSGPTYIALSDRAIRYRRSDLEEWLKAREQAA